ncbi:MAG: hypothetical protein KIT02_07015 [Devosia sp.]|uniref:hypothetical protein n=1 Tax=Devosia sp. TaxID=1871048 RepID=UPI0024CC5184|nr:hypothetical protein [Devosia sp.]UYO00945.1 MAG: hypothetical protein KIT02_07015 [Devosia sp.]
MRLTIATLALTACLVANPVPAMAQDEEAVWDNIENIHGNADGFFEVFGLLQDALMFGDPVTFGQYGLFPMAISANGEVYDVLEPEDLVDNFDMLVSADTQQAILEQDVADLIVTSEGVGIGNGAMWITNICLDDACAETQWGIFSINN